LIGLRQRFGADLIDYPKKDRIYQTCRRANERLYGRGFTIWKSLPDIEINRNEDCDVVIFGSIWRQRDKFEQFRNEPKVFFLDGEDHNRIFEPALEYGKYFKRERLTDKVNGISFSIPGYKLRKKPINKTRLLVNHITDKRNYIFSNEQDYYDDIARTKYVITRKKSGWDCMRHYEIAANWSIPCFYKLNNKPETCAPFDLKDMVNVISYDNDTDLNQKIKYIERNNIYEIIQYNAFKWVKKKTCKNISRMII